MNMNCKILISLVALLMALSINAQKRKTVSPKKKTAAVVMEKPSKFEEMLNNTQQIVFIDSVVVDKHEFLKYYLLTPETGTVATYNKFFNSAEQPYSTVYVNELGNKCWYSKNGRIFTSDKIGTRWDSPVELEGLGNCQRMNYPFMLTDGTTLYFAAISDEGLGGLDIYVSRYDSESGKYLLAENIGLPFNSESNDYMYVVDELNNIGYFATDRRQAEGMVCIYTFIPNQRRISYADSELDKSAIVSRARLERIADTWGDRAARNEALERLELLKSMMSKQSKKQDFCFVINDDTTYHSFSDFKDSSNRQQMSTLLKLRQQFQNVTDELDKARQKYASNANMRDRERMKTEIQVLEQDYYQLESDIHQLEKLIRTKEIQVL